MRPLSALVLLFGIALVGGCGKKQQPAPEPDPNKDGKAEPAADPAAARNKQLAVLKVTHPENRDKGRQVARRAAIEELSWLAEDDPAVLPALVELLKDKTAAGRTLADQINSTREAAALAIMACTKGEAVMKEQGLPVLREGLRDPSAVVREHTAYTIGQIGPVAKPLASDVQKLCTDPDENVRGVAFDTLRVTGVADPVALARLLKHDNEEIVRLAAELIPLVTEMPAEAVEPLAEALKINNPNVRAAAAEGLAVAGPKAASAAPLLAEILTKSYPDDFDPKVQFRLEGAEAACWKALAKIGAAAVAPTAKLLAHPNAQVRSLAARTLGEIGPGAKAATDALKKVLGDKYAFTAVEAAVTLCELGEAKEDAVALIKRALDEPNGNVAATAIEGIYRMGSDGKPLVPLALAKMNDAKNPYSRLAAITLVGLLPPEEATKSAADVGKQATDVEPAIRRRVGRVLAQLGPAGAPAAEALGKALPNEKEPDIRNQFVEALVTMGAGAKPALPALLPLLTDKGLDTSLRARALAASAVADPGSPEVAAALVKTAADEDLAIRGAAAGAIGKLDPLPPDALNVLVKMAKTDSKYGPRVAALRALTAAGPRAKPARAEVEALTSGAQPGLALWAKVALAAIDGDVNRSAPTVRAGLTDRNVLTRAASAEALLVIGPTTADLPVLLKLMKDPSGTTKTAVAVAAGRLGVAAKDAVPQLRRLLDDSEIEVRIAAADALGLIGSASLPAVAKLKELLADPSVKLAAQRALDRIEKK